LWHDEYDLYS